MFFHLFYFFMCIVLVEKRIYKKLGISYFKEFLISSLSRSSDCSYFSLVYRTSQFSIVTIFIATFQWNTVAPSCHSEEGATVLCVFQKGKQLQYIAGLLYSVFFVAWKAPRGILLERLSCRIVDAVVFPKSFQSLSFPGIISISFSGGWLSCRVSSARASTGLLRNKRRGPGNLLRKQKHRSC